MSKTLKLTEQTWQKVHRMLNTDPDGRTHLPDAAQKSNTVMIRNLSYVDCPQFGILIPYTSAINANASEEASLSLRQTPVLAGTTPTDSQYRPEGNFVVTCEPIKHNAVGRAWYAGVFPVWMDLKNQYHTFADVARLDHPGFTMTHLVSTLSGPCRILYIDTLSQQQLKLAIVHHSGILNHSSPSAAGAQFFQWVRLTHVGSHPMKGRLAYFNRSTGTFSVDTVFEVDVFRYPTYTDNLLYHVDNVVATVREADGVYIALNSLPVQLAVSEYSS